MGSTGPGLKLKNSPSELFVINDVTQDSLSVYASTQSDHDFPVHWKEQGPLQGYCWVKPCL